MNKVYTFNENEFSTCFRLSVNVKVDMQVNNMTVDEYARFKVYKDAAVFERNLKNESAGKIYIAALKKSIAKFYFQKY